MPTRITLAALLALTPLVWSMENENTALVKSLAIGVFAAALLATEGFARLRRGLYAAWPVHALVLLSVASAAISLSPSFAWPAALLAVTLWVVAAASAGVADPGFWRRAVAASAVLPVALGLLQALGTDPTAWGPIAREHFHGRITSTLGNPNFLAAWLAGVLPFLVWSWRPAGLVLGAFAAAALLLTGSKGGLLGLAACGAVTFVALRRASLIPAAAGPRARALRWAVPAAGLIVILAVMPADIRNRILLRAPESAEASGTAEGPSLVRNESVRFRLLTWTQTVRMARQAPLLGVGLGRYQVVYPKYRLPEIIRMFGQHSYMTDHPENLTLEITAELGLAGLVLWVWLLGAAAVAGWRRLSDTDAEVRWLGVAGLGSLAGLLVTNSFGVDIHYGSTAALGACVVGMLLSRTNGGREQPALRPWSAIAALLLALAWVRIYASDASLARAMAASTAGRWDYAIPEYARAVRVNPGNVMARYFGASALLDRGRAGDLPEAKRLLESVRREAPDYVLVNYKEWLLYNRLALRREAEAALSRQISLDPLASAFYLERGRLAMEERRWNDAERDFETAIRVEPENPSGFQYLGNFLVVRGRLRDALGVYDRGLARHPDSEELHYNAAVAAYKLGQRKLARAHAEAVLRRNPGNAAARAVWVKAQ